MSAVAATRREGEEEGCRRRNAGVIPPPEVASCRRRPGPGGWANIGHKEREPATPRVTPVVCHEQTSIGPVSEHEHECDTGMVNIRHKVDGKRHSSQFRLREGASFDFVPYPRALFRVAKANLRRTGGRGDSQPWSVGGSSLQGGSE